MKNSLTSIVLLAASLVSSGALSQSRPAAPAPSAANAARPAAKPPVAVVYVTGQANLSATCGAGPAGRCAFVADGRTGSRVGAELVVSQPGATPVHLLGELGGNGRYQPADGQWMAEPVARRLVGWTDLKIGTVGVGIDYSEVFKNFLSTEFTSGPLSPLWAPTVASAAARFQKTAGHLTLAGSIGFNGGGGAFHSWSEFVNVGRFGAIEASLALDPTKAQHYGAALRSTSDDLTVNVAGLNRFSVFRLGWVAQTRRPAGVPWSESEQAARLSLTGEWGSHEVTTAADVVGGSVSGPGRAGLAAMYSYWCTPHFSLLAGGNLSATAHGGRFEPPAPTFWVGGHWRIEKR